MNKKVLMLVIGLVAVAGFSWLLGRSSASGNESDVVAANVEHDEMPVLRVVTQEVVSASAADEALRLQAELAELMASGSNLQARASGLESELANARSMIVQLQTQPKVEEVKAAEPEKEPEQPRRRGFEDYMERLKKEDPERYAEMQKRREDFRTRMTHGTAERATFVLDIDTSRMSEEQLANHEKLVETLGSSLKAMEDMPNLEGDAAREVRTLLHDNMHTVSDLYKSERAFMLQETARELGYADDEVEDFSQYIQKIYDMTSMRGMFTGRGGRGR